MLSNVEALVTRGYWAFASVTEELDFKFYLFLINLTLNKHMLLVATALNSFGLQDRQ